MTQRFDARTAAVDGHVVALVTRDGLSSTATTLGCDVRTVGAHVARWIGIREGDVAAFRPRILTVATVRIAHEDHVVLADADTGSLLDVAFDHASARRWIAERKGSVELAVVDVDPRSLSLARTTLPDTPLAVSPRDTSRAVTAAAVKSFRRWSRSSGDRTRNDREAADLVCLRDADLTPVEQDTLTSFWPATARAFRRSVLAILDQIEAGTAAGAQKAFLNAEETIGRLAPGCDLILLLRNWGDLFATGAGRTWLDVTSVSIREIASSIRGMHDRPGFTVVRLVLAFCDVPRDPRGGLSLVAIGKFLASPDLSRYPVDIGS